MKSTSLGFMMVIIIIIQYFGTDVLMDRLLTDQISNGIISGISFRKVKWWREESYLTQESSK